MTFRRRIPHPARALRPAVAAAAVAVAVLTVAGGWLLADDGGAGASGEDLDALRRLIVRTRTELTELNDQERGAAEELRRLNREADLVRQLLARLDVEERHLGTRRDSLQASLQVHGRNYDLRRDALARRLRALYMRGPQHDLEQILASESFSTLVARLRFGAMVARLDAGLVAQTREQGRSISTAQQQLQVALTGLWEAREEATRERARLETLEVDARALHQAVARDRERTAAQLTGLEAREQRLQQLLADLEARERTARPPGADAATGTAAEGRLSPLRGTLDWPVAGEVTGRFGRSVHPDFKTVTVRNGITVAATPGAPVYAVAAAHVEFAERLPGFGLCVILDHGAGQYTLYANLARLFVSRDRDVSAGQILAELGRGEHGERPELYFEIRQGREPEDPLLWLRPGS